tara:strand:+ start:3289 stop:3900 length:612 start_codon:yes stop_codon:yes gene_type:complete
MFWGKPDASVGFCEDKYIKSDYVAEYYNTLSSFSYIVVGIFYYKTKLKSIGISIILLGIGTGVLHSTLRYYGQILDEGAMLVLSFNIINKIRERQNLQEFSNIYLCFLVVFYLTFYTKFYIFFSIFSTMQIYTYNLIKNRKNKKISKSNCFILCYRNIFVFSFFCWMLDQFFCGYVKQFHLHAIWHIGTSISLFVGLVPFLIN